MAIYADSLRLNSLSTLPQRLMEQPFPWWYPVGAQVSSEGTHFRVWAPDHDSVRVWLDGSGQFNLNLRKEIGGYFQGFLPEVREGVRYGTRWMLRVRSPIRRHAFSPMVPISAPR